MSYELSPNNIPDVYIQNSYDADVASDSYWNHYSERHRQPSNVIYGGQLKEKLTFFWFFLQTKIKII